MDEEDYELSNDGLAALKSDVDKMLNQLNPFQLAAYITRADNEGRVIVLEYLDRRPKIQQEVAELLEKNIEMHSALLEDVVI